MYNILMAEKLFKEPSSGTVIVHDVDGNTQETPIKKLKFRPAVYGILKNKDSILLQWNPIVKKYNLPGGAVELGEKIKDALVREYLEETGISVRATKLLDVKEDFLVYNDEYAHSILLFYEVEKVHGDLNMNKRTDDSEGAKFIHFDKINIESFTPLFKEILLSIMSSTENPSRS
jgi:ADP-ribose pyrophosphatase YjhB (NUDIX family)